MTSFCDHCRTCVDIGCSPTQEALSDTWPFSHDTLGTVFKGHLGHDPFLGPLRMLTIEEVRICWPSLIFAISLLGSEHCGTLGHISMVILSLLPTREPYLFLGRANLTPNMGRSDGRAYARGLATVCLFHT